MVCLKRSLRGWENKRKNLTDHCQNNLTQNYEYLLSINSSSINNLIQQLPKNFYHAKRIDLSSHNFIWSNKTKTKRAEYLKRSLMIIIYVSLIKNSSWFTFSHLLRNWSHPLWSSIFSERAQWLKQQQSFPNYNGRATSWRRKSPPTETNQRKLKTCKTLCLLQT